MSERLRKCEWCGEVGEEGVFGIRKFIVGWLCEVCWCVWVYECGGG